MLVSAALLLAGAGINAVGIRSLVASKPAEVVRSADPQYRRYCVLSHAGNDSAARGAPASPLPSGRGSPSEEESDRAPKNS
jgi:hypothetical protein